MPETMLVLEAQPFRAETVSLGLGRTGRPQPFPDLTCEVMESVPAGVHGHGMAASVTYPSRAPLITALVANAVFSSACALILLSYPDPLAQHLGVSTAILRGLGGSLAIFVVGLVLAVKGVRREQPEVLATLAVVGLDAIWVLGTVALLPFVGSRVSDFGFFVWAGVGAGVAALGIAQWFGLARLFAEPNRTLGTDYRIEIAIDVPVRAVQLWPMIADLGAIGAHLASLAEVSVEGEPGEGAVRTCSNQAGQRWSEHITGWDEGHGFDMRFLSERPDFPYPMEPMLGGWKLTPLGDNVCQVAVWWSFSTKPRWIGPALIPMMLTRARWDIRATVISMVEASRSPAPRDTAAA